MKKVKDYLTFENARNRQYAQLYTDILAAAFPEEQSSLIAHHLTFVLPDQDPDEIPAADTLIFCHDIMHRVFGSDAVTVMRLLAETPVEHRDEELAGFFYTRESRRRDAK